MDYTEITIPKKWTDEEGIHAIFTHMRANDPVPYIEVDTHRPFYAISKHADIIEISKLNDQFLNGPRSSLLTKEVEAAIKEQGMALKMLIHLDNPDHKMMRDLTKDWFMSSSLKMMEEKIAVIAQEFVGKMLDKGPEMDFVQDIAVWYPLRDQKIDLVCGEGPRNRQTLSSPSCHLYHL